MIIKTSKKFPKKSPKWHSLWLRQPGDLGHARLNTEHDICPSPPGSGDQDYYLLGELLAPPPVQGLLAPVAAVRRVPLSSEISGRN